MTPKDTNGAVTVVQSRSTFRQRCAVSAEIRSTPEEVWALLTQAARMVDWNSTLTSIEGDITPGGTVRMQVPEAPGRTFKIKITRFEPNEVMVWQQGTPGIFLGSRTYRLTPIQSVEDPSATRFEMVEEFSGVMLPIIAMRLPDFGPIFKRYAADLKMAAEK